MSKKNKIRQTPWSLGSLPLSDVPVRNPHAPLDRASLLKQIEQEERERDPIYQQTQKLSTTMSQLLRESSAFWGRDLQVIKDDPLFKGASAVDLGFQVPARLEITLDDVVKASEKFQSDILPTLNYTLSPEGGQRTILFALAQVASQQSDMSVPGHWTLVVERLNQLGAYQPGEITFKKLPQPETKPSLTDIENETDERKAKRLANELYYDERQPMVRAWFDSLKANFGFVISADDIKRCKQWFERNGKSFLNRQHYDECRRWNVSARYWPETMLTEDERLCRELDELETSNMSFNDKQALRAKLLRQRKSA
jgi:hypothetical protein